MPKDYQHIFFDLDRTLWDFETNAKEALTELFEEHNLSGKGVSSAEEFITRYKAHNDLLWEEYRLGNVSKELLRVQRFFNALKEWEIEDQQLSEQIAMDYVAIAPKKTALFPHTMEVLDYLRQKYVLHIITNGFEEVQHVKLQHSALTDYFQEIITSERAGVKKPHPQIFTYALEASGANTQESIMIGDSPEIDLEGAKKVNMDQVYFNPEKHSHDYESTHEIHSLIQLKDIL